MNIVFFCESYPPQKSGVATCVWLEKQELEKRGHTVYIVTPKISGYTPRITDDTVYYTTSSEMFFGKNDQRIAIPDFNKLTLFLYDKEVDIVHTHTDLLLASAALLWASNHKVPVVYTMHTHWQEYINRNKAWKFFFSQKTVAGMFRFFVKQCAHIIAPSKKGALLASQYKIKKPVSVVPNAVLPAICKSDRITIRKQFNIPSSSFVYVTVGRVSNEKRSMELLQAFTPYLKKNSHICLLYVGAGLIEQKVVGHIQTHGIENQVIITGFQDHSIIGDILKACDVYVTASLSEMHSISLLEALEQGLPVITRKEFAYDDVVIDGVSGYQCKSDQDLAAKACEIATDISTLTKLQKGAKKISSLFTVEKHVDMLETIYYSAAQEKRK